uniref:Uncharacterized protein n=1 Tax=Anguilla anguilla TaxID=7936 RepID=A0A0E9RIH2_ANGAN
MCGMNTFMQVIGE